MKNLGFNVTLNGYVEVAENHIMKVKLHGCTIKIVDGDIAKAILFYLADNGNIFFRDVDINTNTIQGLYKDKESYSKGECINDSSNHGLFISTYEILDIAAKANYRDEFEKNDNIIYTIDNGKVEKIDTYTISFEIINRCFYNVTLFHHNDSNKKYKNFFLFKEMAVHFVSVKVTEDGVTRQEPSLASQFSLNEEQEKAFKELEQAIRNCANKGITLVHNTYDGELFGYNSNTNNKYDKRIKWSDSEETLYEFEISHFSSVIEELPMTDCSCSSRLMIDTNNIK